MVPVMSAATSVAVACATCQSWRSSTGRTGVLATQQRASGRRLYGPPIGFDVTDAGTGGWRWDGHRDSVLPPLPLFLSVPRRRSWSQDACCAGLRWDVTLRVPAPVGDAGADTGTVCCRRCPSSRPCRGGDRDLWTPAVQASGGM